MTTSEAPSVFRKVVGSWEPKPVVIDGVLGPWPAVALAALLGSPSVGEGDVLPPLWHEVYLRPALTAAELGPDGHPAQDMLVPDIANRRRMFGGGRIAVTGSIRIGDSVRRVSEIDSMKIREGRSGWMLLVTERHQLFVDGQLCVTDERDIVYRLPAGVEAGTATVPRSVPAPEASIGLLPDERLLFMFSALTYNVHRIHYDRTYTTEVEGHPELVVHGPLIALMGLEVARRDSGSHVVFSSYRLLAPAYCGQRIDFQIDGREAGSVTVTASQGGRKCLSLKVFEHEPRP
ncbi:MULTISPECIES: hypothetical protein [unclassified Rhodococcus (in: high G+C Gram-positive bacteria)]|uniref:hypothetical protein n=1 Tax=unclassified Rhodococcus (in: high G+C Gram-positive bacteria) TaxID=192944 RepID=UPI00117BBBAC|nr:MULTISPECIES: hypothetical protein [unclassified Rhodococcus (in: high G+C Gram-positive bacteria)]